jgi:hypothetical protein
VSSLLDMQREKKALRKFENGAHCRMLFPLRKVMPMKMFTPVALLVKNQGRRAELLM